MRSSLLILSIIVCLQRITGQEGSTVIIQPDSIGKKVEIGYSEQFLEKAGSVSIVNPSDLRSFPAGKIPAQLQGRASGVNVTGSGQPGTTSKVRIRGFASFINNDPLYIIDGVPTQDIAPLNPNDIESLVILKDASAAIYGSRASNGVIIITTRKGINGLKVTYDMFAGRQYPGKGTAGDVLNTQEYGNLQWLVYKNDGTVETHPTYGSSQNPSPSIPHWAGNTDWYDAITDPAILQNHDLTFSGGNEYSKFFTGFGAYIQNGIVKNTSASRYSARINSDFTFLNKKMKFGENFTAAYRTRLGPPNLSEASPIQMGPYRQQSIIPVTITTPIQGPAHDFVPGEWGGTGIAYRLGLSTNPVADLTRDMDDQNWDINLIGNAFFDLTILKGLNLRSSFGGTWNYGYIINYMNKTYENSNNDYVSDLEESAFYRGDWVWTNLLTFDRIFGPHNIMAVAGYESLQYDVGREMLGHRAEYFSDDPDFRTLSNGAIIKGANSGYYTPTRVASLFIKADYGFAGRYLLSAVIRRDGSSRFGINERYGIFPSVSATWRISEESFLDRAEWISDLKIRGSYGTMGNQFSVSPYNQNYLFKGSASSSYYDLYGTFTSAVTGFYPVQVSNPDAKWETNTTTSIGFDAALFKNTIGITFDWYSKNADDLLLKTSELPGTAGNIDLPYINIASMSNKGVDLELSYRNIWGNFGFSSKLMVSVYRNEITGLAEDNDFFATGDSNMGTIVRNQVGNPVSSFYGYRVQDIFKNDVEVARAASQEGAEPGFMRFENQDTLTVEEWSWKLEQYIRKNYINSNDRTFIGDPNPAFTYGLNLAITWKSFDLSAFIYGSQGNEIFNYNKWWTDFWPSYQGQKSKDLLYNSWTTANLTASVPKASNKSNFSTNTQVCSYYIENGSYLRLKILQVGYTLPGKILNKVGAGSLRLYLQAVNLFTISGYSGLDPEIGGSDMNFGIDYGNYPNAKQLIFGINLSL